MVEHVIFTPEADDDVAAAYGWYEAREHGLGEDFLRCVEAGVQVICRNPQIYPVAEGEIRHALLRRFPFEIFYEVKPGEIVINSVFHCSQNPQKWRERYGLD